MFGDFLTDENRDTYNEVTVEELRRAGMLVIDAHEFMCLLDNIAFVRGENAEVKNCIAGGSRFAKESYYVGTIEEARRAYEIGPYWDE